MKQNRNALLLVFAVIGVCAVLFVAWNLYRQSVTKEQSRAAFTAPPPSGIPDILHATPGQPPVQPH